MLINCGKLLIDNLIFKFLCFIFNLCQKEHINPKKEKGRGLTGL